MGDGELCATSERSDLLLASDDDIVTWEHAIALYRGIEDSELAVYPAQRTADPIVPVAPMRRAALYQAERDENAKPS